MGKASKICPVGKCKYIIMCGPTGGIFNDPILLRVEEDEWWFSLADSDINMFLQGVNHDGRFNVDIAEIDVAPVQIQGPKAPALMDDLRGATKNAEKMWNHILDVGEKHNLKVIAPGHHRRIEAGLMSYNQDIDWEVTPYECGLGWQVDLKREDDFIGKKALKH